VQALRRSFISSLDENNSKIASASMSIIAQPMLGALFWTQPALAPLKALPLHCAQRHYEFVMFAAPRTYLSFAKGSASSVLDEATRL
jgi:hypothetical protein